MAARSPRGVCPGCGLSSCLYPMPRRNEYKKKDLETGTIDTTRECAGSNQTTALRGIGGRDYVPLPNGASSKKLTWCPTCNSTNGPSQRHTASHACETNSKTSRPRSRHCTRHAQGSDAHVLHWVSASPQKTTPLHLVIGNHKQFGQLLPRK